MKKHEIIDLCITSSAVQYVARTKFAWIFFCISEEKEYTELVFEEAAVKNEELFGQNRILSIKTQTTGKRRKNRYTFFYRETRRTTVIFAKSMELYRSGSFLGAVGRYAAQEWKKRHICLPSLMTAILLLETDNGKKAAGDIRELVKERTDNLALRKAEGGQEKNWKSLWGQENYVLAAQYLQEAEKPYSEDKEYEKQLIRTIEENRLTRFDFSCFFFCESA